MFTHVLNRNSIRLKQQDVISEFSITRGNSVFVGESWSVSSYFSRGNFASVHSFDAFPRGLVTWGLIEMYRPPEVTKEILRDAVAAARSIPPELMQENILNVFVKPMRSIKDRHDRLSWAKPCRDRPMVKWRTIGKGPWYLRFTVEVSLQIPVYSGSKATP